MDESIRAKETGERLRELRAERGQAEVAEAIGVSTMAISQYETGKRIPQDKIKIKLARYFGQSVESLFYAQKVSESMKTGQSTGIIQQADSSKK